MKGTRAARKVHPFGSFVFFVRFFSHGSASKKAHPDFPYGFFNVAIRFGRQFSRLFGWCVRFPECLSALRMLSRQGTFRGVLRDAFFMHGGRVLRDAFSVHLWGFCSP